MPKSLNFYHDAVYQSLLERIDQLPEHAVRRWGKMSITQMLHHLNVAIGGALGFYELKDVSIPIISPLMKWYVLHVAKDFLPGTPTSGTLKVRGTEYQFTSEKEELKTILEAAKNTKNDADWKPHTLFGPMTREEWGKLIVIHVNHHLKQFGY